MRFQIRTAVAGSHYEVFAAFDHDLLHKLAPPLSKVSLKYADHPSTPNGIIRLQITLLGLIRQDWECSLNDYETRVDECHFVDRGVVLPWPLKQWRHDHRVLVAGNHAAIVDDIEFSTGWKIMDGLMMPVLWSMFALRRPVYRRIFGRINK